MPPVLFDRTVDRPAWKTTVRVETVELRNRLQGLGARTRVAESRALNRTIQQVQTVAVRAGAADTGLPQRRVRQGMSIQRATTAELRATLTVSGRRIPIIDFGARQTRSGVTYRLPGGGRTLAPGGFLATMMSGHTGAWRRHPLPSTRWSRGRPRTWTPNLGIVELRGPSLARVFERKIAGALTTEAPVFLEKHLLHEISVVERGIA